MSEAELKRVIFEGLRKIAPESEPESLTLDANVRKALDIDSYDFLNFLIGLNDTIGVDVPESDYGKLRTLGEMVSYLSARIGEASGK
ncbi:MAG: acyl carrier protein [Chthoniobacterales bacterium]